MTNQEHGLVALGTLTAISSIAQLRDRVDKSFTVSTPLFGFAVTLHSGTVSQQGSPTAGENGSYDQKG